MKLQKIIFAAAAAAVLVFAASCKATGDTGGGGDEGPPPVYLNFDPNGGEWAKSGDSEPIQVAQHHGLPLVLPRINQPSDEEAGAEWDEMNYIWTGASRNGDYIFLAWIDQEAAPLPSGVDYDLTTYIQDQGWTDYNTTELIFDMESFPETLYALWMEPPEWGRYSVKFAKFADTSDPLNSTETALAQAIISTVEAKEENNYILASTDIPAIDGTVLRANYTRADTNWHKFDSQANPSTAAAAFDFSTAISGNTTFVAKWNPNSYTLNFSTNGDATDPVTPSTVTGVTYTYPATVTSIPSVTRPHYIFSSWKNGSDTLAVGQLVTASKTYTAQWTGATYTVTFRSNGGIFSGAGDSQTRAFSGQYPAFKPTVPTPSNDAFDIVCYNTKSDNSGQILENGRTSGQMTNPVGASVDYYAIWSLKDNQVYEPSSDEPWKGETVTIAIIAEANYRIELWGAAGGPAGSGNPSNYTWNSGQYVLADGRTIKSAGDPLLNGKPSPSTTGDASGYMSGGGGAYVAGTVHLNTGDTLVINIGGARIEKTDTSSGGGFNGGGSGYGTGAGAGDGAGGGATDVRINGNELKHRIIVAAGGGGSSDGRLGGSNYTAVLWKGGYAGIFGNKFDYEAYTTFRGAVNLLGITGWESAIGDDPGWGALRDKGGMCPINTGQAGKWGYGGNAAGAAESYGAGGGGWFGGSSGGQQNANGAGGGGSSYVSGIAGFIACAETSTDATIPATGKQTNRIGGFVPRYQPTDSATDTQRATSWTGYTFTNVTMIDGGGYKCVWDSSSGDAIRTLQAMPKPSGGYYPLGYGHEGPGSVKINKVP